MLRVVVRRVLIAIPMLLASSLMVFVMTSVAGDPAPVTSAEMNPRLSEGQKQAVRVRFNLHEPVLERYWDWVSDAVRLDLGEDNAGKPVWPQIRHGFALTLRLIVVAIALAVPIAVAIGAVGALRQYSVIDHVATFLSFVCFSLPVFWLAVLLKLYGGIKFNDWLGTRFFATVGHQSADPPGGLLARLGDYAGHTILPATTLILVTAAQYSRFARSSMLDVINADYVRTARAKGLRPSRVVLRHVLRTALIPLTTVIALDVGSLLGGVVVTETVFQWRGMGSILIDGLRQFDVYKVSGWLLVSAAIVIGFNLVADVLYGWLDPRVRG
ncbi:MAG: ABC transporter permease [Acidimicrobiales bacterium]